MKRLLFFTLSACLSLQIFAQSPFLPYNRDTYHKLDRLEIKALGKQQLFTTQKQYTRQEVTDFILRVENEDSLQQLTKVDLANIAYLKDDNWSYMPDTIQEMNAKKPVLKYFYRNKADLYHVHVKDFDLHLNPVLQFTGGKDIANGEKLFVNTRGLELSGVIDERVAFYTFLGENQVNFPNYVDSWIFRNNKSAIPGENYWKSQDKSTYDFLTARGYISFNFTKHINASFGYDRQFVGNGFRSLILSDFSGSYPFLKLQTKIWKFKYTVLWADLVSNIAAQKNGVPRDGVYPRKFLAHHHLSIDLFKNFNIGVFESIINSNGDSSAKAAYDITYFNPIIFYRSIEQNLGSNGNALLGLDYKWNLWKRISLYGQITLDEFLYKNMIARNGWWANKYGIQFGGKYIDAFGLKNLDLQGEINYVRPYTYSHTERSSSYSNYNQPLAHPNGANFREMIGILYYQPHAKLFLTGKAIYTEIGYDSSNVNYGQNILAPNSSSRPREYGNVIGQGAKSQIAYLDLTISYMLKHNFYLDLQGTYRKEVNQVAALSQNTTALLFGVRWNVAQRRSDF